MFCKHNDAVYAARTIAIFDRFCAGKSMLNAAAMFAVQC